MKPKCFIPITSLVMLLMLLIGLDPTHGEMLDLFQRTCPYTDFCTADRLLEVPQNDTTPCCFSCFCDEACHAFRDCCPDLHFLTPREAIKAVELAVCTSVIAPTDFAYGHQGVWSSFDAYRMFATCPSDYVDTDGIVRILCERGYDVDRGYDDTVIVSGPNNVIYRNKYCALCHGVKDAIRWQLEVIICSERLENVHLKASTMMTHIMKDCLLISVPPDNLRVNSRLLPCQHLAVSFCTDDFGAGSINETITGCEDGPYMPFQDEQGTLYKNALCYHCTGHGDAALGVCSDTLDILTRSPLFSVTKLLDTFDDFDETEGTTSLCGESEITDTYANECRALYCPPFEAVSYGRCLPIAYPDRINVKIRAIYWTDDIVIAPRSIQRYNDSSTHYYVRRQAEPFKDLDCPSISAYVYIYTQTDTNRIVFLRVDTEIGINESKCTIRAIGNAVRNQASPITALWTINDEIVKMKGHYSFYRNTDVDGSKVDVTTLMYYRIQTNSNYLVDAFVVCPYVEINLELYKRLLDKAGGTPGLKNITALSETTETLKGVYVLSESRLAICFDEYLSIINKTNQAVPFLASTGLVLLSLSWFGVISQLIWW